MKVCLSDRSHRFFGEAGVSLVEFILTLSVVAIVFLILASLSTKAIVAIVSGSLFIFIGWVFLDRGDGLLNWLMWMLCSLLFIACGAWMIYLGLTGY